MLTTMPKQEVYDFTLTPADETIIASKGTASKLLTLTETCLFLAMNYKLREFRKVPMLPLWRSRVIATWYDERAEALEAFAEAES